jgi:hypothetical protein
MYYFLVEDDESLKRYRHLYKTLTDEFVAEKKVEFTGYVVNLENLVGLYFDALNPIFEVKLKSFV